MFEIKDAFSDSVQRVERVFVSAQAGDGLPDLRRLLLTHAASNYSPDTQVGSADSAEAGL